MELVETGAALTDWAEYTADLSAYAGASVYLAFVYRGDNGDDWWVDDIIMK